MPDFAPSITETDLLTAIRTFLLSVLPNDWEVVQGQDNRVPEPGSPNFIVMTPVNRSRLSTNVDTFSASMGPGQPLDTTNYERDTQADIQLDIHGEGGADGAQTVATLWRDGYAVDVMAPFGIAPLYATDGHQVPFINGEQQFEDRWVMTLYAQMNPIVSTTTQFADTVAVTIEVPIDAEAA